MEQYTPPYSLRLKDNTTPPHPYPHGDCFFWGGGPMPDVSSANWAAGAVTDLSLLYSAS